MCRASYLSLLFCLSVATAQAADVREEFQQALARAEAGQAATAESPAMSAYVLYPYLSIARLRVALEKSPGQNVEDVDGAVASFLSLNPDLPPTRELRRHWLNQLAERADWARFLAHFDESNSDAALRCHRLSAWLNTGGGDNLKADALQIWMTGQQLPQACTTPFEWLQEQGELSAERKEQRARLALQAGNAELAEWLLKSAPPERVEPMQRWIRLLRDAKTELRVLAARPELPVEWSALRDAFSKLSRNSTDDAQEILPQLLQRPLEEAQRKELLLLMALAQSWERRPEALEAFRQLPDNALDARGHEWRVRAALWQDDWPQVLEWLARMPPELATQPRWSYWRARALEAAGQRASSAEQFRQLSAGNNWYAVLAARRAQIPYQARSTPSADEPAAQAQLLAQPAMQRARELFAIGRIDWANSEWNAATAELTPNQRIQAGRLAASWGWTLQAAAAWKRAEAPDDLDILYPQPFQREMRAAAKSAGISADWINAIARQESLFLPQARSRSEALGLLQVKLDTARHVARRSKQPLPVREDLFNPAINAPIGAAYLAEVLKRFEGHLALAVASYNAGPNAVARWLPEQPVDAEIWMENVPYNETRDYIQKVLWNAALYSARSSGKPVDVSPWLAPVRKAPPGVAAS